MKWEETRKNTLFTNSPTRREFLRVGGMSLLGAKLLLSKQAAKAQPAIFKGRATRCIVLNLTGGPGHLDTWDMKPHAPTAIRSPFQPIKTNVPSIEISEIFPRMARHADKFAIVRSMRYEGAVAHDTRHPVSPFSALFTAGQEFTPIRSIMPQTRSERNDLPEHITLPCAPPHKTTGSIAFDLSRETEATRERYGRNRFGHSCLLARRLIERGTRFITVDMFDSRDSLTWDAHGSAPFPRLDAYKTVCGPWFDNAYTSLIEDLQERGLYDSTIVLASGEFGRTPKINAAGGRGHWSHCWSLIIGGGGIRGGQVVGVSDDIGGYPIKRPVPPADIAATLRCLLGHSFSGRVAAVDTHPLLPAQSAQPVFELL